MIFNPSCSLISSLADLGDMTANNSGSMPSMLSTHYESYAYLSN